jgi:hypothetical protein
MTEAEGDRKTALSSSETGLPEPSGVRCIEMIHGYPNVDRFDHIAITEVRFLT